MTTATLHLHDARLKAQAVRNTVELVQIELERNAYFVSLCGYLALARYKFYSFRRQIDATKPNELRDPEMARVGEALSKQAQQLESVLRNAQHLRPDLRWSERRAYDHVAAFATNLAEYGQCLQDRAALGNRPPLFPMPKLTGRLAHQAGMASLFMKPVPRDSAESLPDPDYGL